MARIEHDRVILTEQERASLMDALAHPKPNPYRDSLFAHLEALHIAHTKDGFQVEFPDQDFALEDISP